MVLALAPPASTCGNSLTGTFNRRHGHGLAPGCYGCIRRGARQILAFIEELAQHGLVAYDAEQFQDGRERILPCTTGIAENLPDGGREAGQLGSGMLRYERPRLELLTLETRAQGVQGSCPSGNSAGSSGTGYCRTGTSPGCYFNYSCWGAV